jgi:hypothetical protein
MASPWAFLAGQWQTRPTLDLSTATDRTVTWRLTGNSEASFQIGTSDLGTTQAAGLNELITDLWINWNGAPLFRGRIGGTSDTADANGMVSSFGAADYRAILQRRILYEGNTISYLSQDQSAIAWGLVSTTQGMNGGDLGIVRGIGQTTGVVRDRSDYQYGDSIGQALDNLSQVIDGFDYDFEPNAVDASLAFNVYYPARGVDKGSVLDYGGRVTDFTRQVDPATYGNAVRATGGEVSDSNGNNPKQIASVFAISPTVDTDPTGRWDLQFSEQSITVPDTLRAKAVATLRAGLIVQPSWQVTLGPGTWGGPVDDFWLGDQVILTASIGRLNVVESLRVVEIGLSLSEDDVDTFTVTLGSPNPALRRTARYINRRVDALERR